MGSRTPTEVNICAAPVALAMLLFLSIYGCVATTLPKSTQVQRVPQLPQWLCTTVCFASAQEAAHLLGTQDECRRRMAPLGRSLRVRTSMPGATRDDLQHASRAAVDWTTSGITPWAQAVQQIAEALQGLTIPLPAQIVLIRTNSEDELHANYTQSHRITLPRAPSSPTYTPNTVSLLAHQLFYIASHVGPTSFRHTTYALAGFHRVTPGRMPPVFEYRRHTNPHAFTQHHAIKVRSRNQGHVLVGPVLSSRLSQKELTRNTTVQQVEDRRLALFSAAGIFQINDERLMTMPVSDTNYPAIAPRNTCYTIHRKEILAGNLALLLQHRAGYPTTIDHPKTLDRLLVILHGRDFS
ncbi:MAG: hypothetical protein VX223_01635 [Myxococcota bacterium]|nr:hypothetical protein [Myxococcota bacterium]